MTLPSPAKRFWDPLDRCMGIIDGIWFEGRVLNLSFLSKSDQELGIYSGEGHCSYLYNEIKAKCKSEPKAILISS